jgi:peptidoglycan/LPS O-acetylase OafA/YrhL
MLSGSRGLLLGFIVALILMFVLVGGGGPPYPGIDGFTPYRPIAIALLATFGPAVLVSRLTHNTTLGISTGLSILALALVALAQIATFAYVPAGLLVILAFGGFIAGSREQRSRRQKSAGAA